MRAGCAAPGRSFFPTSRSTRAWRISPPSRCARVASRPADGAGAAADLAGIKLPLVEAALPMPVCEIGDLIMGDVRSAAASRLVAAGLFAALSALADGPAGGTAGSSCYILGVVAGTALLISSCVPESPSGLPTKSYPGH